MDSGFHLPADTEPEPSELLPGEARLVDWTTEQYFDAHEYASRSGLEELRSRPERYFLRYEAKTLPREPPSPQMIMGTHVHLCSLEPDEWTRRLYPPMPERPEEADGKAKKDTPGKIAYQTWKAQCVGWSAGIKPDSIVLGPEERARIEAIAERIREHSYGSILLGSPGVNEQTIIWRHPTTGLLMRVRLDRMTTIDESTRVVLDLKTTADPSPRKFGSSIASFGYHRQAAVYYDAVRAMYPDDEIHYVLGVVCTSAPYEVAFYQLEEPELELGRIQYEAAMQDLLTRRATNEWRADWQRGCARITLPGWAYHEE